MRKYNWKKGILFIGIWALLGFIVGFGIKALEGKLQVHSLVSSVKAVMPYLYIMAFISGVIGLGGYCYFSVKLKQDNYSSEEDSFYERNEKVMSMLMMCATLAAVINFTAFGVNLATSHAFDILFIINVLVAFIGEVGYVSLMKKVRPELDADPMNTNFSREYFDKLDEYEKNKVGKASMKTITAMVPVYVCLFLGCYVLTIVLGISPVVCLPIGIIWGIQTILYTCYSIKEDKN